MKKNPFNTLLLALAFTGVLSSCSKDEEYTLEDQPVTGNFTYITTSFIPITVDPNTQQPLSATITMEGSGTVAEMGVINFTSTFKFDFVAGKGTDFVTTYTGTSNADSFHATGSSQQQQDGSIIMTETFSNGTGKYSKIKGGGTTIVNIYADQTGGTGAATWTVSY